MKRRSIVLLFAGTASHCLIWAHSTGAPAGYSGAPNDDTCVSCHTGTLNSGKGSLTITFPDPSGWAAGQKYRLHVTLQDPSAARWGFELTNRKEATQIFEGAFAVPSGAPVLVQIEKLGSQGYATHSPGGTFQRQTAQAGWDVDWTAPAAGTGTIRFYAAGNAANNDGNTTGDKIYTTNLAVPEAVATPPAVSVGNTVLNQFVFGAGWYTGIYFTNTSASQATINVNFYSDGAQPLSVGGGTSRTLILPAGGTQVIEAQNTGSTLVQGWATFDLPTGVDGYGVFRQSVAGKPDQEAVVPFASSSGTKALLTYDNGSFVTATALWYNGTSSGTVTVTAFDEVGSQIGTVELKMSPGTKQAFVVTDQIAGVNGHRGSLVFSTSSGSIAVLGLRFGGSAFTSIPAVAIQ
jgi:hypothetical protein